MITFFQGCTMEHLVAFSLRKQKHLRKTCSRVQKSMRNQEPERFFKGMETKDEKRNSVPTKYEEEEHWINEHVKKKTKQYDNRGLKQSRQEKATCIVSLYGQFTDTLLHIDLDFLNRILYVYVACMQVTITHCCTIYPHAYKGCVGSGAEPS